MSPNKRAARLRIPPGRAEADEGRHQIDLLGGIGGGGERVHVRRRADHLERVAQPLHRRAGDEDRAFERIAAFAAELIGDGGQKPILRGDRLGAGIEQGEAAGAVGRFHHAGLEAALPYRRRLLIARHAKNADRAAEQLRQGGAEVAGAIAHLRQQAHGHAEQVAEMRIPAGLADIEQQRARRIGGVGRMHACRRSGARAENCRRCRTRAGRRVPRRAHPRRDRAASRSWSPRNKDRAAARCAPRSRAHGRPPAAPRSDRRCAGPARRWRCGWGGRSARSQTIVVSR